MTSRGPFRPKTFYDSMITNLIAHFSDILSLLGKTMVAHVVNRLHQAHYMMLKTW